MTPAKILKLMPVFCLALFFTLGEVFAYEPEVMRASGVFLLAGLGIALLALRSRDGPSPVDITIFIFIWLAVSGIWLAPLFTQKILAGFAAALLYAALFLMAALPPVLGLGFFTEFFARKRTPPQLRETDIYRKINLHLNWFWAGIFVLCGLAGLVPAFWPDLAGHFTRLLFHTSIPLAFLLGVGFPLTRGYPDYYQRKLGLEPVTVEGDVEKNESVIPRTIKENVMSSQNKVVAVNGSPHVGMGSTDIMLDMLAEELALHGLDLEVIHLHGKDIGYCVGCALCLNKGKCWQNDDHKKITDKLFAADAVILASPVYFRSVTGQMKTFFDRCLVHGHNPRAFSKPGLAVSVSAGWGETEVGAYLANSLHVFGAYSVGTFTAMAVSPGAFCGKEAVEARAKDLAGDLARALKEKRRYPPTDQDFSFWSFMGWLVRENKEIMAHDYEHWQENGLFESFEKFIGLSTEKVSYDSQMHEAWIKKVISEAKNTSGVKEKDRKKPSGAASAASCYELIEMMPRAFNSKKAGDLKATIQFKVTGSEDFSAYLSIENQKCLFQQGEAAKADIVITTPADLWMDISTGKVNGQTAFMSGKYQVKGDMSLLLKMGDLFGG